VVCHLEKVRIDRLAAPENLAFDPTLDIAGEKEASAAKLEAESERVVVRGSLVQISRRNESRGARCKDGTAWEKVVWCWFGFEPHLLVDAAHEFPVNYQVTKAPAAGSPSLLPFVQETKELHPEVIENCQELSADKGYDSEKNKQ
jgi:hypothetical protein